MRTIRRLAILPMFVIALIPAAVRGAEDGVRLEDFEGGYDPARWTFSNGAEFPGARGGFERSAGAVHAGKFGGKLSFDFSGGGNYVGVNLRMPEADPGTWNSLRLWLKRPEGNEFVFRYSDAGGQTFQKQVDCPADRWVCVTIPFNGWTGHWGGADDGTVRGGPKMLSLLVDQGLQVKGDFLFDDLQLCNVEQSVVKVSQAAYRFEPGEGWHMRSEGNRGESRLEGRIWKLDFSAGARSLSLSVPDHVLLGDVDRIRVRVRGSAKGHPVRLVLHTHFMTFHKVIGEFAGQEELVTDGPPGTGWEWYGGENDGKIHGPLRLGEIGLGSGTNREACTLELVDVRVDASCPQSSRCVMVGEARGEGDGAAFVAQVRALSDAPMKGELSWVLRGWDGEPVGKGTRVVVVPAKGEPFEFRLPIGKTERGARKFLEAEFTLNIPGQEVAPVCAAWVAPLEGRGDAALEPDSPFGMGVYLNRYGGDDGGLAMMERAAQMARDAGVKWSREDFSWGRIEPERGRFDWSYHDKLVACARRNGITIYAIVGYWTDWTRPYTQEGIDDYVTFLKEMVRRYRGKINQWEIWNEPNIFFWQGPRDLYAELLKKSYAAIKEIAPEAQVLGLSTAGIDRQFISRMLELQAPFDVLTIHPYRRRLNDLGFIDELKQVSDLVRLPDGVRRPVWLTEMGWATHTPHNTIRQDFAPNTLRAQAELISRSYLCAIVSGVDPRTFWYDFRNDGEDPIYFEHQMGIVYNDFRPKPACVAYTTLTRVLRGMKLAGAVAVPQGVLAYDFKRKDGAPGGVTVVWSPQSDAAVELPIAGRRVSRINGIGEQSELEVKGGSVRVGLKKGAPVYLCYP